MQREPTPFQWAIPDSLDVPRDDLQVRLDFYRDAIVMYVLENGVIHTRLVSALDVVGALTQDIALVTDLLPAGVLWWASSGSGNRVALWHPPRVWKVALVVEPLKPPLRMALPMPGLIFICVQGQPPWVFAAKKRPQHPQDQVYHAPLFNVFRNGQTCPGTHKFPEDPGQIPESFFMSFFSMEGDHRERSKRYPDNLLKLWQEIDGKKRFPLGDLVPLGKVEDIMK